MRNVSLEKGRIRLRNGPRSVLLAEALFEVLKLLRKVDARMEIIEDSTWNIESEEYYWSCFQLSSNRFIHEEFFLNCVSTGKGDLWDFTSSVVFVTPFISLSHALSLSLVVIANYGDHR